jgi:hypothetical protein
MLQSWRGFSIWCRERASIPRRTRLQRAALPAELSRQLGLVIPLRLCPNASVPSDVGVSLHAARPGRAHPGPSTPCDTAAECMDTPEVKRMTSLELVAPTAMTNGVVVLFPLSYIRKGARRTVGQYRRASRGNLLKNVHRRRCCDPWIAGPRQRAGQLIEQSKRPGSLRNPGLQQAALGRTRG